MRKGSEEKICIILIFLIISFHVYTLLQLIFFPYPELFVYSYLTSKGLLPYKEIFDQHFPGLMFLPINLYSLGIDTLQKMRIVHLFTVVVSDAVFVLIARKYFKEKRFVIASLFLYIFWQIYFEGNVLWIDSLITPILMYSFYNLLKYTENKRYKFLLYSGIAFGVALGFKQTVLPLILMILVFLKYKNVDLKKIMTISCLIFAPILIVAFYFYKIGSFKDFIYWTITFNLTIFSKMGKTQPNIKDLIKLLPTFGLSALSLLYFFHKKYEKQLLILSIYLAGSLFFAYARFDFVHLQPALPYAIFPCVILMTSIRKSTFTFAVLLYVAFSIYIFLPYYHFNNKPGVSPMFNDRETILLVNTVKNYVEEGDRMFSVGTYPHIYYLTKTIPSGKLFTFQFPWFMKINENKILQGIIDDPPKLIIRDNTLEVGGYLLSEYMKDINRYVDNNYKIVNMLNNIEFLVKI